MSTPDVSFALDFLSNALATLLGVFLGLAINRRKLQREQKQLLERETSDLFKRKKQLLNQLFLTIGGNIAILEDVLEKFPYGGVLYFNVDLIHLEATSKVKYDILSDIKLCARIDSNLFRLKQLYELIILHRNFSFNYFHEHGLDRNVIDQRERIRGIILDQAKDILTDLREIQILISEALTSIPSNDLER